MKSRIASPKGGDVGVVELTIRDLDSASDLDAQLPRIASDAEDVNSVNHNTHSVNRNAHSAPAPLAALAQPRKPRRGCAWLTLLILSGVIGAMWYGYAVLVKNHDIEAQRLAREAIVVPALAYVYSCGAVDPVANEVLVVWNITYQGTSFLCSTQVAFGVMPLAPGLGPYRVFINQLFGCAMTESKRASAWAWGMTDSGVRSLAIGFALVTVLIVFAWWGCFHRRFGC